MFFYMETPTNHMHVTGVFLVDPTVAPRGFSFDQLRALVAKRLHRAAPLRRRLVEVPFGIAPPVWIEDPAFDLDYHVRRACLPSPGSRSELEQFVGEMVGLPLDRQRPLWEIHLVEGLEGGLQAIVVKMHHAAIDGVSGAELPRPGSTSRQTHRLRSTMKTTGSPSASRARPTSWSALGPNWPPALPKRRGRPDVVRRLHCASQSTTARGESCPLHGLLVHRRRHSTWRSRPTGAPVSAKPRSRT